MKSEQLPYCGNIEATLQQHWGNIARRCSCAIHVHNYCVASIERNPREKLRFWQHIRRNRNKIYSTHSCFFIWEDYGVRTTEFGGKAARLILDDLFKNVQILRGKMKCKSICETSHSVHSPYRNNT